LRDSVVCEGDVRMKKTHWMMAALAGMALIGRAEATTLPIYFSGPGVSGSLVVTIGATTDATYPNAFEITGISGTFTDTNTGVDIIDASVTGLQPINHATPADPKNIGVAPNDFSMFPVASGLPPISGGVITYDNLFWPGGASPTAWDYPGDRSFLDIYGLAFTISGGDLVDLFSNGVGFGINPGDTNVFGVVVATPAAAVDYVANGVAASTPEASTWAMMILGFAGLGFAGYRKARKAAVAA
jgi:PEP-CTERM motif-containing protein